MARPKPSPGEIVERLQIVEALVADGRPLAEAIASVGMTSAAYEKWRNEYSGLLRTLGSTPAVSATKTRATPRGGRRS